MKKATPKKKKKSSGLSTVILVLILLAGVGIMAYPTVSDWWNSMHQSRAVANYSDAVANIDNAEYERLLADAAAYNRRIASAGMRWTLDDEELAEYSEQLRVDATGIMGYIEIEKINCLLPIYHGTDEAVLQIGVGHIEGSSLPVGGESTHSVLSGHRGLPSARLFTDLDQMEAGDVFVLRTLAETLTYEVDQILIVEPSDVAALAIESGRDYCTLVTCTPYGINTHRLLVRGHRIETTERAAVIVTAGAVKIPTYIVIPAVGIPLLFLFLMGMLIYYRRKPRQLSGEELMARLREQDPDEEPEEGP